MAIGGTGFAPTLQRSCWGLAGLFALALIWLLSGQVTLTLLFIPAALIVAGAIFLDRRGHRHDEPADPSSTFLDLQLDVMRSRRDTAFELTGPGRPTVRRVTTSTLPGGRGTERLNELLATARSTEFTSSAEVAVRRFGTELFESVFDGALLAEYRHHCAEAERRGHPIRLALRADGDLAALPWEYLYDPVSCCFLALSTRSSIVRRSALPETSDTQPIDVLRILLVASSPGYLDPLTVEPEQDRVRQALAPAIAAGAVEVQTLSEATLAAVTQALERFDPHVFYFAGHGRWDEDHDEGAIVLVSGRGRPEAVTSHKLGVLLRRKHLRLAVLNACDTARTSPDDCLAGVATGLVAQGVPAAVGMQYRLEDRAGSAFGEELLRSLADGTPLDEAVGRARRAVFALPNDVEWATPTLLTRVPASQVLPRGPKVAPASGGERASGNDRRRTPEVTRRHPASVVDEVERMLDAVGGRRVAGDGREQDLDDFTELIH